MNFGFGACSLRGFLLHHGLNETKPFWFLVQSKIGKACHREARPSGQWPGEMGKRTPGGGLDILLSGPPVAMAIQESSSNVGGAPQRRPHKFTPYNIHIGLDNRSLLLESIGQAKRGG